MEKVLLGFSGGIDSCASVLWLMGRGYDVTAVTFDTTGDGRMVSAARTAAHRLGVKWMEHDVREIFEQRVVRYFLEEYLRGATPSPCVRCNTEIKWQRLYEIAQGGTFDHIATGHYFRIERHRDKFYVAQAADASKDQSYYLWGLGQHILEHTLTPMGGQIKSDVKKQLDCAASQKESMGVCFAQGKRYAGFLEQRCGAFPPGDVVDGSGRVIATHNGYPFYTVGQRRGFPSGRDVLPGGMAVCGIDPARNLLRVGPPHELLHDILFVEGYYAADPEELTASHDIAVKIRGVGRNPAGSCRITPAPGNMLRVALDIPAWAAAKGQPVVFYRGQRVVGGGYLHHAAHAVRVDG